MVKAMVFGCSVHRRDRNKLVQERMGKVQEGINKLWGRGLLGLYTARMYGCVLIG